MNNVSTVLVATWAQCKIWVLKQNQLGSSEVNHALDGSSLCRQYIQESSSLGFGTELWSVWERKLKTERETKEIRGKAREGRDEGETHRRRRCDVVIPIKYHLLRLYKAAMCHTHHSLCRSTHTHTHTTRLLYCLHTLTQSNTSTNIPALYHKGTT